MSGVGWQFFRYRDKDGNDPVWLFLTELITDGERGQIVARMQAVMEQGTLVSGDIVENLPKEGLYVLRAPNTPNNPRIFMCLHPSVRRSYVMLHAYRKKDRKIPPAEMNTARKRRREVQDQPDRHIIGERQP